VNPQKIRENRARVWAQMQDIQARADAAGGLTVDDRAAWDAAEVELQTLTADLERAERAEEMRGVDYGQVIEGRSRETAGAPVDDAGNTEADYRAAFEMWARFGSGELTPAQRSILRTGHVSTSELRAQGVGTTTAGGYTVPTLFRQGLVEALRYYSGVRQVAENITTDTGASLPWVTNNDTANVGAILGENTQVTEQDLTFGTASLDVYMYTSKLVRVSLQLLQDSALDLDAFLPRKLGERIGRIQNQHFTTGTGTAQPLGLVTGGTAVAAGTGNATSFGYDALVDATARLDPAYLTGGNLAWMGSQAALAAFRKLKDGQQRPLWEPSLQVGTPDTLLGYRYILNNDVPVPAANAKSLLFGDFRAGYVVRDVTGVQTLRLDERYADFLQVGFLAFQRSGATVQDTSAYTVLQNSAT
jgi:HK97 family phage major capsid protein